MWNLERITSAVANVTLGTVIVLAHIALADRNRARELMRAGSGGGGGRPRSVSRFTAE